MRVLIVGEAGAIDDLLADTLLEAPDVQLLGTATQPVQAYNMARAMEPDIILVDGGPEGKGAVFWTQEMASQWPAAPTVVVIPEGAVDVARQALLAGARMFVNRPFHPDDLLNTLRQVYNIELQRRSQLGLTGGGEEGEPREGRLLVVFGPKGGAGRTTVAINLAIALQQVSKGRVVLVDSAVQFGEVALALNIHPPYNIMDLLQNVDELDQDMIKGMLTAHSSGVQVLPASPRIELPEAIQPGPLRTVLGHLKAMYDYVVVDTWSRVDETILALLEMADTVLLVITPGITALRNAQLFLELAGSLQYPAEKVMVVLNQMTSESVVKPADVEELLGRPVAATISSDSPAASHALNVGVPLVLSHRRSRPAKDLVALAKRVAEPVGAGGRARHPAQTELEGEESQARSRPAFGIGRLMSRLT